MTYTLLIADRSYSSWSLRGCLTFACFGIPVEFETTRLYEPGFAEDLKRYVPAKTVPALRLPEGGVLTDSIAIAEEVAFRHPNAKLWPSDPVDRALARSMVAEMHSGFVALRDACPMNIRTAYTETPVSEAVRADLARLEYLWSLAPGPGPWLFGDYSIADVFFAPVAMRIAAYTLPVGEAAQALVAAHLAHPEIRKWRALALCDAPQAFYRRDYPEKDWPGPEPLPARASEGGPAVNALCPYSSKPVTHFLELDGRIYGFCNETCRNKTLNDPAAWPAFAELAGIEAAIAPTA